MATYPAHGSQDWDLPLKAYIDGEDDAVAADLDAHKNDTTDAHDATAISVNPAAGISSNNAQGALEEVAAAAFGVVATVGGAITNGDPAIAGPLTDFIEASSAAGPMGPEGPEGPAGPPGANGLDGEDGAPGADGAVGADGAEGPQGVPGEDGADGASAYEIALLNGFVGTEVEWLESLVGPQGEPGEDGAPGAPGAPGADGVDGVDGAPGVAGADGEDGTDGTDGTNGTDGTPGAVGPVGPIGDSVATSVSSGVYALNPLYGTEYTLTLLGNITITASGLTNGASLYLALVQDGVGGRVVTIPSDWIGADQFAQSSDPNTIDIFAIWRSPLGYHINRAQSVDLPSSFWSPNALANRIAWLSANAIAGEDGDVITSWPNPWGVVGTAAGNPQVKVLNGQKYVNFDGVDDHVDSNHGSAVNQPFTYAFVAKSPGNGPVVSGSVNTAIDIATASGNWQADPGTGGPTRPNTGSWQTVVIQIFTGGDDSIRVDGTAATGPVGTLKVGTYTRFFADETGTHNAGGMAEFIKVTGTLDSPTLANVETYLNQIRDDLNGI